MVGSSSRLCLRALAAACAALVLFVGVTGAARADDDRTAAWQERLARVEAQLRRVSSDDAPARERMTADLAQVRQDISAWLATYPPARDDTQAWLEKAGAVATVEDLAAEVSRLRAAVQRVRASLQGEDAGSFYLGRVDVAVSAEAGTAATTAMTPAGTTVIDAQDLRATDRSALAGALALAPGVSFVRVGSRNETAVYVRGFDMRQVPLFIDGIPIYTPYDGTVDLERFTTFDVSEVRVSKGFTSVLQGPNALGGAINIVSRRPSNRLEGMVGATYGAGNAATAFLNAGSRLKSFYLQGGGSYLESDTFPLSGNFAGVKTQPGGDRVNAYRRDGKFNVKLGWTPNGSNEYAISYVGQRGKKGNPPYAGNDPNVRPRYWRWPYWDKDSLYLVSNTRLGASSYVRGRVYYDVYKNALHSFDDATFSTQKKSSSFKSLYHDWTVGGSLEWGLTIGNRQTVRVAGHVKRDAHEDNNVGEPEKRFDGRTVSGGIEYTYAASSRVSFVTGVSADRQTTTRADDFQKGQVIDLIANCKSAGSTCGGANGFNPQLGLFLSLPTGQVRLTAARKTRLPSMKDRFSYKMGTAVPNPGLKAEHNTTLEAGYQGTLGPRTSFMATVFYSRIDDLIQRFYLQPNLSQQRNIGEASSQGVELDARTQLVPRVDIGANYTYLKRKHITEPANELVDTPRHKGRVSATAVLAPFARLMLGVDFERDRRTQNEAGAYKDVPAFATATAKASVTIARKVDVEATVLNLFDKDYWVADGYPEAGRMVMATLRWTF